MKLLLCVECGDVVKLRRQSRSCECGRVSGQYRSDGAHADVSERAVVIGLLNCDVQFAIQAQHHDDAGYRTIRAFVFGRDAPRVHWQEPKAKRRDRRSLQAVEEPESVDAVAKGR